MQNAMNPLVTMYQSQLEASRRFADAVFAGTEKIDRVMIGATQRVFNEQLNLAQAMTAARDPRAVGTTWQSSMLSRSPDDAMNYQKEIVRIVAEMQNEISRSMQDYMEQIRTNAASNATRPLGAAQVQTNDAVFNPMTSMFSVWESAFKEVAELAKKNMVAAKSAAEDATHRAGRSMSAYAEAAAGAAHQATSAMEEAAAAAESASDDKKGGKKK
ncbi:phasin family protein [Herbaspirillum sp. HC18]|nr:phasin family protein [Herbaspirillum sp. HC18]